MSAEVNFDGLVGPTHSFSGLAEGNVASTRSAGRASNPRAAALQGLDKMARLVELGVPQAVLPPHPRPDIGFLHRLGFTGRDAEVVERAAADAPTLFAAATSASAMWVANAATVTPSADAPDRRVHLTPANLAVHLHRAIEAPQTTSILRAVFADPDRFVVHDPLPAHPELGDEGAANHTRFSGGVHCFVYGRAGVGGATPVRHPARQTEAASRAIARGHGLVDDQVVFAQQHPAAIDAGVFHNDVIAVGHQQRLLVHEQAFVDTEATIRQLRDRVDGLRVALVTADAVPLDVAVRSYLFNSQLVTDRAGETVLIAPLECERLAEPRREIERLVGEGVIDRVEFVDLTESMGNGGGPACLRLRVVLEPAERDALGASVMVDGERLDRLRAWVERHYRDELTRADLADPELLDESHRALDELTGLLDLGAIYPFQH